MQLKKILLTFIFVIGSFLIFNSNVSATDIFTDYKKQVYTEDEIYNTFITNENFNINTHSNILCVYDNNDYKTCYALDDETFNSLYIKSDYTDYYKLESSSNSFTFYKLSLSPYGSSSNLLREYNYPSNGFTINYYKSKKQFLTSYISVLPEETKEYVTLTDFSSYMITEEPEEPELEITIKATNILNFMLDKTKNFYEVLINNEIFKLCLGVLLSYLIFIVVIRIIKK